MILLPLVKANFFFIFYFAVQAYSKTKKLAKKWKILKLADLRNSIYFVGFVEKSTDYTYCEQFIFDCLFGVYSVLVGNKKNIVTTILRIDLHLFGKGNQDIIFVYFMKWLLCFLSSFEFNLSNNIFPLYIINFMSEAFSMFSLLFTITSKNQNRVKRWRRPEPSVAAAWI